MTIQYHTLDNTGDGATAYRDLRWSIISNTEGFENGVLYYDSNGILSNGFGFNLQLDAIKIQVMKAMGLDTREDAAPAEKAYVDQIRALLNANGSGVKGRATGLQTQIDAIMATREADPAVTVSNKKPSFVFSNEAAARVVFDFIADNNFGEQSYEGRVDDETPGLSYSQERAVLFSLAYNGILAKSPSLKSAIASGDRVTAWYQIRYVSNGDREPGIAKRRYYESQVFGLYDNVSAVKESESKKSYELLNAHRKTIFDYEKKYAGTIDGTKAGTNANSILDYGLANSPYRPQRLEEILAPAAKVLLDLYGQGQSIDPLDIYVSSDSGGALTVLKHNGYVLGSGEEHSSFLMGGTGTDTLTGGAKNDVLYGGAGTDTLIASLGLDHLNGGDGKDIYNFSSPFDNTIISGDTDGGSISIVSGVTFRRVGDGEANLDGLFVCTDDGDNKGWSVSVSNGTATLTVTDADKKLHTIVMEGFAFDGAGNNFGLVLQKSKELAAFSGGGDLSVDDGGIHTAVCYDYADDDVQRQRVVLEVKPEEQRPELPGAPGPDATQYDLDQHQKSLATATAARAVFDNYNAWVPTANGYIEKAMTYSAAAYEDNLWHADEIQRVPNLDNDIPLVDYFKSYSIDDEYYLIKTPRAENGIKSLVFEGSNKNDLLQGADWTAAINEVVAWDNDAAQGNDYYRLSENIDPKISGKRDVLFGLNGDDRIIGDGDIGTIDLEAGNADVLVGGAGKDQIYGGGGNDYLYAAEKMDEFFGRASVGLVYNEGQYQSLQEAYYKDAFVFNKLANGGAGADTTDKIILENADDSNYLNGGEGNDVLAGGSFDDALDGGNGNDMLFGGAGKDIMATGKDDAAASNLMFGDSYLRAVTTDKVNFKFMADFIAPDKTPDMAAGKEDYSRSYFYKNNNGTPELRYNKDLNKTPNQKKYNALFNDVLAGGAGADEMFGEIGNDVISGGGGSDTLYGDRLWNSGGFAGGQLDGTKGHFQGLNQQYHGNDVIDGGAGNDTIIGGGGDDHLTGGDEAAEEGKYNDIIYGDIGMDVYDKAGSLSLGAETAIKASDAGWWGDDFIEGGKGNDLLVGEGGIDTIDGGNDNDVIYGDWNGSTQTQALSDAGALVGKDTLYGGSGNDQVYGGGGDDIVEGGSGDDFLYGDDNVATSTKQGKDTLIGGSGNDQMFGNGGNDTYIIGLGDGIDSITDIEGDNVLQLNGAYVKNGKLVVKKLANGSVQVWMNADGSQRINMNADTWTMFQKRVKDANGNVLAVATELEETELEENDDNYLAVVTAGAGDSITVHNESDGNQAILLTGSTRVAPARTAINLSANAVDMALALTGEADALTVHIDDWDAFYGIQDSSGAHAGFLLDASANSTDGYNLQGKSGSDELLGGAAAENLLGNEGDDIINGGGGDDYLSGGAGDDVFIIGASDGNDTVNDSEGHNTLRLSDITAGTVLKMEQIPPVENAIVNRLYLSSDKTRFVDMNEASWNALGDIQNATGEHLALHIVGATGYMAMTGGYGNNSYQMARGGLYNIYARTEDGTELLVLPDDMALADFSVAKSGNDLRLNSTDGTTSVMVRDYFSTQPNARVWEIVGTKNAQTAMDAWVEASLAEPTGDYVIEAEKSAFNHRLMLDLMDAGRKGKSLDGSADVTFYGSNGAGKFQGNPLGAYEFAGVTQEDVSAGYNPVLMSSERDDVDKTTSEHTHTWYEPIYKRVSIPARTVRNVINVDQYGNAIYGSTTYLAHDSRVEVGRTLRTETITAVDSVDVEREFVVQHVTGEYEDNVVTSTQVFVGDIDLGDGDNRVDLGGAGGSAFIVTGSGDDQIIATGGYDFLSAGGGFNRLKGGGGNDTYRINLSGDTVTFVNDSISYERIIDKPFMENVIVFEEGVTADMLTYRWIETQDLYSSRILQVSLGDASVFINETNFSPVSDFSEGIASGVQFFSFSDGAVLTRDAFLDAVVPLATVAIESLSDYDGYAFSGNDVINGNADSNMMYGGRGDDELDGRTGNDTLYGESGDDDLWGDLGNDTLSGGDGSDFLGGDEGYNTLLGGAGSDTFLFIDWLGHDTISDATDEDILRVIGDLFETDTVQLTRNDNGRFLLDYNSGEASVDIHGALTLELNGTLDLNALTDRDITLVSNGIDNQFVFLQAQNLLGASMADAEKSRWQIIAVQDTTLEEQAGFAVLPAEDMAALGAVVDGNVALLADFWGSGINTVAFIPSDIAGDARLGFTLQRDDGLLFSGNIVVHAQTQLADVMGTVGNDVIDLGLATVNMSADGGAGDDELRGGVGDDTLYGNAGNDWLDGAWANDSLNGGAGDDRLDGSWGDNVLQGAAGNDTYVENYLWGGSHDVINNTDAATGDMDTLTISNITDYRELWFAQEGDDLLVHQLGNAGDVRVQDWFDEANAEAKLDVIRVREDGGNVYEAIVNSSFDQLVQAMATFGAQPDGVADIGSSLDADYAQTWELVASAG